MSYDRYASEPDAPTLYPHGEGDAQVIYASDLDDYLRKLAKAAGADGFVEESAAYEELVPRLGLPAVVTS
jgi:hypothetical protein